MEASNNNELLHDDTPNPPQRPLPSRVLVGIIKGLVPLIVIGGGIAVAIYFVRTAPKAGQRPPVRTSTLVTTRPVQRESAPTTIEAMGTTRPSQEVILQPQVTGEIVEVNPRLAPGSVFAAGEVLLKIEDTDYRVAVEYAEAMVARAEAQLSSAEFEVQRLGNLSEQMAVSSKELDDADSARRIAKADLAAAKADLERARLNLKRTTIRSPLNGLVITENVDLGAQVTQQSQLVTLVSTDEYWVTVSVPVDRLKWIELPRPDTHVDQQQTASAIVRQRLASGQTAEWTGRVSRLLGDLEPQGRMARLLVTVTDPLHAEGDSSNVPLLLGAYVEVEIEGRTVQDVFVLHNDELHDGDYIWVMNDKGELEIREADVIFQTREQALLADGLNPGEHLVTSDLPAPVAGMPLRQTDAERPLAAADQSTNATDAAQEATP